MKTPTKGDGRAAHLASLPDITDDKRAQAALEASERRFRALLENSADGIALLDLEGRLIYDSPAAQGLLGYEPDELLGANVFDFVHPADVATGQSVMRELIQTPQAKLKAALRFRHKDGSWRWLEGVATNLLGDPAVQALVFNYRDATEARDKQQQIRFQARVLDTIGQAVVGTDMQGRITYWNRAAEVMYGWPAEAVIGQDVIEVLPSPARVDEAAHIVSLLLNGSDWSGEFTMRRRDGGEFPVMIMASPFHDEQGRPLGLISVSSDNSSARQAEQALRDSEKRFRALIEHGSDGIKLLGPDGKVRYASPSNERLLGYTPEEMIGFPLPHAIHPDDWPWMESVLADLNRRPGATTAAEFRARHKDGSWHWIGASITNLLAEAGVEATVFNYRDISDHKRMEAERQRAIHLLGERLKELMVLNRLARVLQDDQTPAQAALQEIANTLPAAWQYPEIAAAEVRFDALRAASSNYSASVWRQQASFTTADGRQGFVAVVYLQERPPDAEGPFMAEERSTLDTLADMLRVYFDRRQAAESARRRAEEFEALFDISRDLAAQHDLAAVLHTITERVLRLLKASAAAMYLYDSNRNELELAVVVGLAVAPGVRLRLGEGLAGKVALNREPMQVDDYHTWAGRSAQYEQVPFRAVLQVPMLYAGELVGVLSAVETTESRKYTESDMRLLSLFAAQAAGAAQEARQLETARRRVEELAALYETSRDLATHHDLPNLLRTICERAVRLLSTQGAIIYLYDAARQELELAVSVGLPISPGIRLALGEGLAGQVAINREPRWLDDYHAWAGRSPKYEEVPVRAVVQVPMLYGGELVGVLGASELSYGRTYTAAEAQLLSLFAAQAAGAVQEARRLEAMAHRLAELEAVNKVSAALRVAQTLEEILPILLDEILSALDIPAGNIRLYDPVTDRLKVGVARGWFGADTYDIAANQGISGYVFQSGLPHYVVRSFISDLHWQPGGKFSLPSDCGGACVAIRTAHETVGVLLVAVQSPREITSHELSLLTIVCEMAGNAIHRTRLRQQTELRLRRLAALRAMDVAISASLDLHVTLDVLLDQATAQLRVHAAAVLTLNPLSQTLEFTAGRGFRGSAITRTRLRLGEAISGQAALERRILSANNLLEAGEHFVRANLLSGEDFVANHAAPLIAKGQVKGVLEVFHREPLNPDPEWFEFFEALAGQAAIALDSAQLFDSLQRSNLELALAYDATIEGWSRALDLRDRETEGHTLRVTELSLRLARMLDVAEADLVHFRRGALLHDIGKMGIPDSILLKPGPLSEEEWQVMRRHPQLAFDMLSPISYLRPALEIPFCHHERWDGSGYPRGSRGEAIPLAARIFAVVDVWDALLSNRPYRPAWAEEQVREYLREQASRLFDRRVVEAFLSLSNRALDRFQAPPL